MRMSRSCCQHLTESQVRQRYNPTFVHEPIFQSEPLHQSIRFTPTFYSTALDTASYNIKTQHVLKGRSLQRPNTTLQKSVYCNISHERRIEDLNPKMQVCYSSKDKWFDHTKQQMLGSIRNGNNREYSRTRKFLDLSSDPVFTDLNYGIQSKFQQTDLSQTKCKRETQCASHQKQENLASELPQKTLNQQIQEVNPEETQIKGKQQTKKQKKQEIGEKTHKNFHQNCIPKSGNSKVCRSSHKVRPYSAQKPKKVSNNPTFAIVRNTKIQNRL